MTRGQFLWGLSHGLLVLAVSGAFWLGLALGPAAWRTGLAAWAAALVLMIGGGAIFVYAGGVLRQRSHFRASMLRMNDPPTRRIMSGLRVMAVTETAMVALAVLVCTFFGRADLVWPAIGLVVSLHFVPLGWLVDVPAYYVTAAAGVVVSMVALSVPLGAWRLPWLGGAMTAIMWSTAAFLVARADHLADRSLARLQ
jgi:hypothetical protein